MRGFASNDQPGGEDKIIIGLAVAVLGLSEGLQVAHLVSMVSDCPYVRRSAI